MGYVQERNGKILEEHMGRYLNSETPYSNKIYKVTEEFRGFIAGQPTKYNDNVKINIINKHITTSSHY